MEPREKLPKVKLSDEIQERENEILRLYLPSADTVPAIGYATGMKPEEGYERTGQKS